MAGKDGGPRCGCRAGGCSWRRRGGRGGWHPSPLPGRDAASRCAESGAAGRRNHLPPAASLARTHLPQNSLYVRNHATTQASTAHSAMPSGPMRSSHGRFAGCAGTAAGAKRSATGAGLGPWAAGVGTGTATGAAGRSWLRECLVGRLMLGEDRGGGGGAGFSAVVAGRWLTVGRATRCAVSWGDAGGAEGARTSRTDTRRDAGTRRGAGRAARAAPANGRSASTTSAVLG